ncbi:P-loop containing nucleoside triphosphate hydrolase protein [Haematococcus lacustris]
MQLRPLMASLCGALCSRGAVATFRCAPVTLVCLPGQRSIRSSSSLSALQAGIVGLPNVGKSTLFNAIVENGKAQAANFPFCTIEPNTGIVTVPDERLAVLSRISKSKELVPTTFEFVDIAGLVRGASKGEGLGNQFLANIRETDAIVQVVRAFEDDDIIHVAGKINPLDDIDVINLELALADLGVIEKRLERMRKGKKSKEEQEKMEVEEGALTKMTVALEAGQAARNVKLSKDEQLAVKGLGLITIKPMIYAANVPEDDLADKGANNVHVKALRARAAEEGVQVAVVSAKVESELNELPKEEAKEWLESLGVTDGGLSNLITATYSTLGLRTYFTSGEKETRAWTIRQGMTAPQAAGVIHSDFEKGFIRAETIAYHDYLKNNGYTGAKEAGALRLEGKEYVVQEGDVMLFRFNV